LRDFCHRTLQFPFFLVKVWQLNREKLVAIVSWWELRWMKAINTLFERLKSEKVVINTTLWAKYGSIYQQGRPGFVFVSQFLWEKNTCHLFFNNKSLWTTHLVAFVKINLLELGNITEITTVYANRLQTMGDKSSWDTSRKWCFLILKHSFYFLTLLCLNTYVTHCRYCFFLVIDDNIYIFDSLVLQAIQEIRAKLKYFHIWYYRNAFYDIHW